MRTWISNPLPGTALFIVVASLSLYTAFASTLNEDDVWSEVRRKLDNNNLLPDIAVIIGDDRGEIFVHEKGYYTRDTATRMFSASKWITGMTIMRLVERGVMSLDDKPSKYIDYWTTDPSDWRSAINLRHLLSFASGYGQPDPNCFFNTSISTADCVREIYFGGLTPVGYPGTKFEYSEHHLLIAGQMATIAAGKDSYHQLIEEEIVIPNNVGQPFRYWNEIGARPGGGLYTTPAWYARVLGAYVSGKILKPETIAVMETDHTPYPITNTPDHYALAHWIICETPNTNGPCSSQDVQHSLGWQGYTPVVDRKLNYWAVFANMGNFYNENALNFYLETRSAIRKAVEISRQVETPSPPKDDDKIDSRLRGLGSSVVAIVKKLVRQPGGSFIPSYQGRFRGTGVCADQPYYEQPIIASCSGFLVSSNQIATSGECIKDLNECRDSFFVFDYALDDKGSARTLFRSDQVYTCMGYVADARGNVIVTLDKQVPTRKPLKISSTKIQTGESVVVIGHPNGLPRKYVERGSARTSSEKTFASFYITDTNAFGDFTGSPIFRKSDDTVVGIFSTKSNGLVADLDRNCYVVHRCKSHFGNDECGSNTATDATSLSAYLNIPCKSDSDCSFSGSCNAGKCTCNDGFYGHDCSYTNGFEMCNMHGAFVGFNQCGCYPGFTGKYCEKAALPPPSITPAPQNTYSIGFGYSVSADGPVVAVGQPFCVPNQPCDGGIVSVYFDLGGSLLLIGQLSNPSESADARCGQKVVVRGEYLFFSCAASTVEGGSSSATIQIYHYADGVFSLAMTLLPPTWDNIEPVDGLFGASLDSLMYFLAVGAPLAYNENSDKTGAVYFYVMMPDSDWAQSPFKITPVDGQTGDNFGTSVALSLNSFAIEQLNTDNPSDGYSIISSHIYKSEQHAAISNKPNSRAPSVYVYAFDPTGFRLKTIVGGIGSNQFATSIALTPTSLVVGDPGFSSAGIKSGAVFVYDIRGHSEVLLAQTLTPTGARDGQLFGHRVATYDAILVVFEGKTSTAPSPTRGFTLYESRPNKISYSAKRRVASNYLSGNSGFGADIAIYNSGVVVGAPLAEGDKPGRGAVVLVA